jgi:hypothetical protein
LEEESMAGEEELFDCFVGDRSDCFVGDKSDSLLLLLKELK